MRDDTERETKRKKGGREKKKEEKGATHILNGSRLVRSLFFSFFFFSFASFSFFPSVCASRTSLGIVRGERKRGELELAITLERD